MPLRLDSSFTPKRKSGRRTPEFLLMFTFLAEQNRHVPLSHDAPGGVNGKFSRQSRDAAQYSADWNVMRAYDGQGPRSCLPAINYSGCIWLRSRLAPPESCLLMMGCGN